MTSYAERVEKGIVWLTQHDPTGAFHLWYTAGISPGSPMPAQDETTREAYREYHKAREQWERLWNAMVSEEKTGTH